MNPDRPPTAPRWRAVVATCAAVLAASVAHVAADGELPGVATLGPLTLMLAGVTHALRHRLVGPGTAITLAVAAQAGLHTAFAAGPSGAGAGAGHAAHAAHTAGVPALTGDMLLAHAVAAALTALVLMWQDHVVGALARLLPRVPCRAVPESTSPRATPAASPLAWLEEALVAAAPRRGPPAPVPAPG